MGARVERLTELQSKILKALERQLEQDAVNFKALADLFGIDPKTMREHLGAIAKKGHLELKSRGQGRNPSVKLNVRGVPLLGHIRAGSLSEALEYPEGYLRLPSYPGKFGLRVEGDSMAEAIQNGDVVLLKKRPYKSGEICAVRIDGSDATLKYLDLYVNTPDTVLLRPHNPEYPTLEADLHSVAVDGVFTGLLRGEVIDELLEGRDVN